MRQVWLKVMRLLLYNLPVYNFNVYMLYVAALFAHMKVPLKPIVTFNSQLLLRFLSCRLSLARSVIYYVFLFQHRYNESVCSVLS